MKKTCCLALLAHVDAGKTTLSEQILYQAGTIRTAGRVDQQNAFLDFGEMERERGITIYSAQAQFVWEGRRFQLIDTPGHADFAGEMERSLRVADCAVLVVSAVEGVQNHTLTLWRLLRDQNVPTFFFINKLDRAGADPKRVTAQIRRELGAECADFSAGYRNGEFSETLAEQIASLDETLLETYLEKGCTAEELLSAAQNLIAGRKLFPLYQGTALTGEGVAELLHGLRTFAEEKEADPDAPTQVRAYQVRHDKQGTRVVCLKVEQGTLHPRDELDVTDRDVIFPEQVSELRRYNGSKLVPIAEAGPGELCVASGLSLKPGQIAGAGAGEGEPYALQPLLSAEVLFDETKIRPRNMLVWLQRMEEEEPLLGVEWTEETGKISVRVMGEIQLEILRKTMMERWDLPISFGECQVLYRETIAAPVHGCGHFEPLRHYAEVHFRLEPGEPGSGITFASECRTDDLAANWQNLIRIHVLEKEHRGVLTGSPLTDVRVVLLAGRMHLKHTEGGDFREAVYRAIRQGLMQAENVLLEPWYAFTAEVEPSLTGRVISDIQKMSGECLPPETEGGNVRIEGFAPVAGLQSYARELTGYSHGKGRLSLRFDGYRPCRNAEEVIAAKGYDPERDVANTPDSVFCAHGAGFPVKWNEAPKWMHLDVSI